MLGYYEFFKVRQLKSKFLFFEAPSVAYKIQRNFQEYSKLPNLDYTHVKANIYIYMTEV